jgi:uncharacterized protein (TIGR03437 family)
VIASAAESGFFSARADVTFDGDPAVGDKVTLTINGREYVYTAVAGDTSTIARNVLVNLINSGLGDPDVTARRLQVFGVVTMQVVARSLGADGNEITFAVEVSDGATIIAATNVENGLLEGGRTPPVVILTARENGRQGNNISYGAETSDLTLVDAQERSEKLCCGNEPFSLITADNPAIPGETIIVYGSGLGLTSPLPTTAGLKSGQVTPLDQLFNVSFNADDFVSSLAGGRTASVEFVGLAPGFVGLYQVNLRLNDILPDDAAMPLHIAQLLFLSNTVTIPVKNLVQRDPDFFGF